MIDRRDPFRGEPVEEAAALLAERRRQQEEAEARRRQEEEERKRREQEEQKGPKRNRTWDKNRSKATYDLSPYVRRRVQEIKAEIQAQYENVEVTTNDVAEMLLEEGIRRWEAGKIQFELKPRKFQLKRR